MLLHVTHISFLIMRPLGNILNLTSKDMSPSPFERTLRSIDKPGELPGLVQIEMYTEDTQLTFRHLVDCHEQLPRNAGHATRHLA